MAKKSAKKRVPAPAADEASDVAHPALDKIAGLLALMYVKTVDDKEAAALRLDAIGFTSREISSLLDVNENFVRVARHRKKKK
ncbi:hypothetical protein IP86_02700 [Rhodopseudomonas sp. AAP120]|nr:MULTISPECIES: hypothetical protein [Rhodopseudomonas]ACF00836.1 hypothetical protein Rpal_2318 [Rhodopseudomonas palustris TIE-1]KPG01740.1 hypothetical protein IP86_02700 [Rhodopseudomonas sp. AAP120]